MASESMTEGRCVSGSGAMLIPFAINSPSCSCSESPTAVCDMGKGDAEEAAGEATGEAAFA